jgi:hypothetical protein
MSFMNAPASSRSNKLAMLAKILIPLGIVVGVGIQFVPVAGVGANPPERSDLQAPPEVEKILRESCFDCHSNETRWPWYAKLAPSSWLLIRDVKKGRARFNMSEWDDDQEARNVDKDTAWEEIEKGEMPPWFYLPMHPRAYLSEADKATLKAWLLPPKTEKKEEPKKDEAAGDKPAADKAAPAEAPK